MKKLRFWRVLVLAALTLSVITSCGDDENDSPSVKLTSTNRTANGYFDGTLYYKVTSNSPREVMVYKAENTVMLVSIPKSISIDGANYKCTSIGDEAFKNCQNLFSVDIPNSVTSIGASAFYCCSDLTDISIPNSVTSIGKDAFYGCSGLTSVTIPNSVTSIGTFTFSDCSGLTSVTIPNSVTSIGNDAFSYCSGLTSVTIPNSVTSIGRFAFSYCSGLTSVTIPNSVTSIGEHAFSGCDGLTSIFISDLAAWCNISFEERSSNPMMNRESHLYLNGEELSDLSIPNSVEAIKDYAFYSFRNLKSVTIPNSVTTIGNSAFYGCRGLTGIDIPRSVTSIGAMVFVDCPLSYINLYWKYPTECSYNHYSMGIASRCTVYIPKGTLATYQSSREWKQFNLVERED